LQIGEASKDTIFDAVIKRREDLASESKKKY